MQHAQQTSYQHAVEVIGLQEPYSDDDLNKAADEWELKYGAPLIRPYEVDGDGQPTKAFRARAAAFVDHSDGGIVADPQVHHTELAKLRTYIRKKGLANIPAQKRAAIVAAVHENEKALGEPLTDFGSKHSNRSPKEITDAASAAYKNIVVGSSTFKERLAAVVKLDDVTTLQLFVELDKSDDVREAAQQRIEELELRKVPQL